MSEGESGAGRGNVVGLRPETPDNPMSLKGSPYSACQHAAVWVNAKERTVTCKKCGDPIPAFDRLLSLARDNSNLEGWVKRARKERARLRREVDAAKKELRSLDGKIKRRRARLVREGKHIASADETENEHE